MDGRQLSDTEIAKLWDAWTPRDIACRLATVSVPWCVTAGWALDLFAGRVSREHDDIEISIPAARFEEIQAAFTGFEWDVVGAGRIWRLPEQFANHFQTWLREPTTGRYRVDVFREPHLGDRWVCRRDAAITLPYRELIAHTEDGIPYVIPEVALLFKAKHLRAKDEADFAHVLPLLDPVRRSRLSTWLSRVHPGHRWIDALAVHSR